MSNNHSHEVYRSRSYHYEHREQEQEPQNLQKLQQQQQQQQEQEECIRLSNNNNNNNNDTELTLSSLNYISNQIEASNINTNNNGEEIGWAFIAGATNLGKEHEQVHLINAFNNQTVFTEYNANNTISGNSSNNTNNERLLQTPPTANVNDLSKTCDPNNNNNNNNNIKEVNNTHGTNLLSTSPLPTPESLYSDNPMYNTTASSTHLLFSSNTNNIARAVQQHNINNNYGQGMATSMPSPFSTNPMLNQNTALLFQQQQKQQQEERARLNVASFSPLSPPTVNNNSNYNSNVNMNNAMPVQGKQSMYANNNNNNNKYLLFEENALSMCHTANTPLPEESASLSNVMEALSGSHVDVNHVDNNNNNNNNVNYETQNEFAKVPNLQLDLNSQYTFDHHSCGQEKLLLSPEEDKINENKQFAFRPQITSQMESSSLQLNNEVDVSSSNNNNSNNESSKVTGKEAAHVMEFSDAAYAYQPTFSTAPFSLAHALMQLQGETANNGQETSIKATTTTQLETNVHKDVVKHKDRDDDANHNNKNKKKYNYINYEKYSDHSSNNNFNVVNNSPVNDSSPYKTSLFATRTSPFTLAEANSSLTHESTAENNNDAAAATSNNNDLYKNDLTALHERFYYDPVANMHVPMTDAGNNYTQMYDSIFQTQMQEPIPFPEANMHMHPNMQNLPFVYSPHPQNDLMDYNVQHG